MSTDLKTFYNEYKDKVSAYEFVFTSLDFDMATIAPKDGNAFAIEMRSIFEGDYFSYVTAPEHIEKIQELHDNSEDHELRKELSLRLKSLHQISKLPKEVYIEFQKATAQGRQIPRDCQVVEGEHSSIWSLKDLFGIVTTGYW